MTHGLATSNVRGYDDVTARQKREADMAYDVEFRPALKDACLHVPKGPERSPGILLLHGSEGGFSGWTSWLALALAMKGFVTFPHPYSKGGNLGFL